MTGPPSAGGPEGLDRRLRAGFAEARLPAAPETLRASLEGMPARDRRRPAAGRSWLGRAVPVAVTTVVLIALVVVGLVGVGQSGPAATVSPAGSGGLSPSASSTTVPSSTPTASGLVVIPWVAASPPPEPGRPTPRPVPPGTRTCQPADLVATAEWQGATGTMAGGIGVTNVSGTPCVLDGPPARVVILAGDRTMTTSYRADVGAGPAGAVPPGPALLEPGDRGGWWLFWANWCGPGLVPTNVVVTLPGGGSIVATGDPQNPVPPIGGLPRCDAPDGPSTLDVTAFEYIAPEPPLVEAQAASVTLSAPPSAVVGQDVTFTVTLTNLGSKPAVLDPCPTYTEDLLVGGLRLKRPADRSYALNCSATGQTMAPGATVVLEMRYPIPDLVAPGPAELIWSLDPGGPFDTGAYGRTPITIVGASTP